MKIVSVEIFKVTGRYSGQRFPFCGWPAHNTGTYPHPRVPAPPATQFQLRDPGEISAAFLRIDTDEGVQGFYGPVDDVALAPILQILRPQLLGADPLAQEALHDRLRHHRHGRAGFFQIAVSAVDLALWDLRGRAAGVPVYRLLGGPTRTRVQAYASMLGFPTDPASAALTAIQYKNNGYSSQKWFFSYGPGDGDAGRAHNLDLARALREAVGPDYPLMFDGTRCWTSLYAREMFAALAPLRPRWIEEPVFGDPIDTLRSLRGYGVPIATGEHIFGCAAAKDLLVAGVADILQCDVDWTGGLTESLKIAALCAAFEIPFFPHGHNYAPALHLIAARPPSVMPMIEFLVQLADEKQFFFKQPLRCTDGFVDLPTQPGLGTDLDESKITRRETVNA